METLFELVTEHVTTTELRVVEVHAEEEVHGTFHARVQISCPAEASYLADLEGSMLGKPAALVLSPGGARRKLHGVISAFHVVGVADGAAGERSSRARIHLELAPRLALLKMRRQSRIFQDMSVRDIATVILEEWKITASFQLVGTYKPRPYITQHGETDFEFLRRILAVEGIGFFIASPVSTTVGVAVLKEEPHVVFFDSCSAYVPLAAGAGARASGKAVFRHTHSFGLDVDEVTDFTLHRKLAPRSAALGDFDHCRPGNSLQAVSHYGGPLDPVAAERGERMDAYFYADRQDFQGSVSVEIDEERAQVTLEQLRRDATIGRGRTRSARLAPGHVFALDAHSIDTLNQDYVVTRVVHHGVDPDIRSGEVARYEASFEVVPAGVTFRPEVERGVRAVRGAETATVVGPKGEDVHTDVYGRVKVRFHWDRDGKGDEHSSCWLRVAEAWAGQRWGSQFVPRVGMEVLVTFLGGDVDRPLVTGCLYNTTHPTPFRLPGEAHRSGFRTQSSDGSGFNELSFQDLAGEEQVFLHARRDFDVTVGHDASTQVAGDEAHAVTGNLALTVENNYAIDVGGAQSVTVEGAATLSITGDETIVVNGACNKTIGGAASLMVAGDFVAIVEGGCKPAVHGSAELKLSGDAVLRAEGHLVAVVGACDAKTSATIHVQGGAEIYSADITEVIAEVGIVLRVGDSFIRITSDTIEIDSETLIIRTRKEILATAKERVRILAEEEVLIAAQEKVVIEGEAGLIVLTRDARIDGDVVKLNCSPEPVDTKAPPPKPTKPTTFILLDQTGKPMQGQRLIVRMSDGTERGAVLDDKGQVKLDLNESGDVIFPDVGNTKPVTGSGPRGAGTTGPSPEGPSGSGTAPPSGTSNHPGSTGTTARNPVSTGTSAHPNPTHPAPVGTAQHPYPNHPLPGPTHAAPTGAQAAPNPVHSAPSQGFPHALSHQPASNPAHSPPSQGFPHSPPSQGLPHTVPNHPAQNPAQPPPPSFPHAQPHQPTPSPAQAPPSQGFPHTLPNHPAPNPAHAPSTQGFPHALPNQPAQNPNHPAPMHGFPRTLPNHPVPNPPPTGAPPEDPVTRGTKPPKPR